MARPSIQKAYLVGRGFLQNRSNNPMQLPVYLKLPSADPGRGCGENTTISIIQMTVPRRGLECSFGAHTSLVGKSEGA